MAKIQVLTPEQEQQLKKNIAEVQMNVEQKWPLAILGILGTLIFFKYFLQR